MPPLLVLVVGVAGISFSAILVRLASDAHPIAIAFWRLALATLMLAPLALLYERHDLPRLTRRDVGAMLATGVALAVHFGAWIWSLFYTTVAASVVIVTTYSLLVPLGAHFLLRERVPTRVAWGILVAFVGVAVIGAADWDGGAGGGRALLGDGMALLGAVAAAAYILVGRRLRQRIGLFTYVTLVYGACSLTLLAALAALHLSANVSMVGFSGKVWLLLLAMAFFPTVMGHTLLNWSLRWLPAPTVSTAILAEPVVSTLLAIPILAEVPSWGVLAGGAITIAGIWAVLSATAPRSVGAAAAT